jgi:hypothetical protein
MSQVKQESFNENANEDDIRSIEGSEWTLETATIGTIGDENAQGNESNSMNALLEVPKPFYLREMRLKIIASFFRPKCIWRS